MTITSERGTYALVLHCDEEREIRVGRLGNLHVEPGWYVYAGSALGPGGLRARVRRHLRDGKRLHWHIDYLTAELRVVEVWFRRGGEREECAWAAMLAAAEESRVPYRGFGASDCRCDAHLVGMQQRPHVSQFGLLPPATGGGHAMKCRPGCGACCIAASIDSEIPGMPQGKPAGVPCIHLDAEYRCTIWGTSKMPRFCSEFVATSEVCGDSREEALARLRRLEVATLPPSEA